MPTRKTNVQIILEKQNRNAGDHRPKATGKPTRNPAWRPQPNGLTRDELRRIVLDTIG